MGSLDLLRLWLGFTRAGVLALDLGLEVKFSTQCPVIAVTLTRLSALKQDPGQKTP